MTDLDWKRAGRYVAYRRGALGVHRQEDAAAKAGVGVETWRQVERGVPTIRPSIHGAIARSLGWPEDMIERLARGEDPPDEAVAEMRATIRSLEERVDQLTRLVEDTFGGDE